MGGGAGPDSTQINRTRRTVWLWWVVVAIFFCGPFIASLWADLDLLSRYGAMQLWPVFLVVAAPAPLGGIVVLGGRLHRALSDRWTKTMATFLGLLSYCVVGMFGLPFLVAKSPDSNDVPLILAANSGLFAGSVAIWTLLRTATSIGLKLRTGEWPVFPVGGSGESV